MASPEAITELLSETNRGDVAARERLWSLVYEELHRVAQRQLAGERGWSQRQATTLVSEAYLRLVGPDGNGQWCNRRHFFAAAANSMRRILIDDARSRLRAKRGFGRAAESLREDLTEAGDRLIVSDNSALSNDPATLLALDEALAQLAEFDPQAAEIVSLRFFAGRTREEIAEMLGMAPRTLDDQWYAARAWLLGKLGGE